MSEWAGPRYNENMMKREKPRAPSFELRATSYELQSLQPEHTGATATCEPRTPEEDARARLRAHV